jgi:hypothetical protein
VGFNRLEPQQQGHTIWSFHTVFECTCTWVSVETCTYTWVFLRKGMYISRKHESSRSYNRPRVSRVCRCCLKFSVFLVGHFPSKGALVRFEVI